MLLLPWTTRPGGSKCASRELARKLHLGPSHLRFKSCLPVGCKSRKHKASGDTGALLPEVAERIIQFFAKPNYLALLLSWQSLSGGRRGGARLEDSNLVDPASSHMLVSKTKPCMSKYKCYTAKLRMAH